MGLHFADELGNLRTWVFVAQIGRQGEGDAGWGAIGSVDEVEVECIMRRNRIGSFF